MFPFTGSSRFSGSGFITITVHLQFIALSAHHRSDLTRLLVMFRKYCLSITIVLSAAALAGCGDSKSRSTSHGDVSRDSASASTNATATATPSTTPAATATPATSSSRTPNELGRIPVLEYHLIQEVDSGQWKVGREHFRRQLEMLYDNGFRPVTMQQVVDKKIDLPAGLSPVVFTFDDASPSQFRYIERNGQLEIDSTTAVGIWLNFRRTHADWENRAVFCMLPAAEAGRSFFGNKGIEGQKTEWRFRKVKFLADSGFELCNHTLWHAQLSKYPDPFVQEQIARGQMAIDSAVPGYRVRTLALPLGLWPKNRSLAWKGSWRDPKSGRTIEYDYDAVLEVSGGPTRSPHDPAFDGHKVFRVQVYGNELEKLLERFGNSDHRYVSDGNPSTIAKPPASVARR
jgi:hypothetical protein